MNFNSLHFLVFFPVVCALNFLTPKKWRWATLLAASYYFYMCWDAKLVWLIAFTTLVSYGAALGMEKRPEPRTRKLLLAAALLACLGTLFFFKYFGFFAGSLAALFGGRVTLSVLLPVGISFYTFQTLSYVIDVYRSRLAAERHLGYYALFVSFFPQLVAGPIERPENLLPQLRQPRDFSRDDLVQGLRFMLCGFFKKIVVADTLAVYVENVFGAPASAAGPAVLLAAVCFTIQIYGDFSGYSDIATGCARILGVRLMRNFDMPFLAKSCREFWARWHISLSSWFRDYLYFPLGGSRRGLGRACLNLMIVFAVSGLWHGAAWTFVLWGVLHGLYQVLERVTERKRLALLQKRDLDPDGPVYGAWRTARTFALTAFAFILFRANSVADLGLLLKAVFTDWRFAGLWDTLGLDLTGALTALASVAVMGLLDTLLLQKRALRGDLTHRAITCALLALAVGAAWLGLLGSGGGGAFIYFRF